MADQDVIDPGERIEGHVADAGAGVDQDVIVDQEGRCPATCGDGAGATEYLDDHALPGMRAPLQLGSSGLRMLGGFGMFSRGGVGHKRPMPHLGRARDALTSPPAKS
jgi:hypothetical protein